ncbi:ABC transporter permease [Taklimakanibacter deserti]|uniref:ABC transporter permease n=1 Tax=Taklimakanibacter deserti TaxID=2267839 RepID=UPI000E6489F2
MMQLSRLASLGLSLVTVLVFTLLYGPLFVPIASSFFDVAHGDVAWNAPSLSAYAALMHNEGIITAFLNTLLVGFSATFLAVILGILFAVHYRNGTSLGRDVMQFVIFLPFLMPPIMIGLALLIFFREADISRSLLTVIIGHTIFVLALAYRTIVVRLQSLSVTLIEASYDLGATSWQTFFYVVLPNLKSALIGAAILCFALSFDETMITILVTGTDNTLPIRLWAMMRLGFTPDINALVALVLAFTTLLCVLAVRYLLPKENIDSA